MRAQRLKYKSHTIFGYSYTGLKLACMPILKFSWKTTLPVRSRVVEQHSVATYRGPCRGHF